MKKCGWLWIMAAALLALPLPAAEKQTEAPKAPERKAEAPRSARRGVRSAPAKPVAKVPARPKAPAKTKPRSWKTLSGKPAPLRIGWGMRDVSSDLPVLIPGGWARPISKGMADQLTVTSLVIDNGFDAVVFLSCDLVHIYSGQIKRIFAEAVRLDPSVPPLEKWIVNATHTHAGPGVYDPGRHGVPQGIPFDEKGEYQKFFFRSAGEAVVEAWKNRAPGKVAWGYGYVAGGFSRRTVYDRDLSAEDRFKTAQMRAFKSAPVLTGRCTMHGPNLPEFSHYEAGMDPFANFLFTFDMKDKLTGAIINLSTTAQCGSPKRGYMSADFWYETRQALRSKYGDIRILAQCAAAGDITPRHQHYNEAQTRRLALKYGDRSDNRITQYRLDLADRIAGSFDEVLSWASKDKRHTLPLCHTVIEPKLERAVYSDADIAETKRRLAEVEALPPTDTLPPEQRQRENSYRETLRTKYTRVLRMAESVKKLPTTPSLFHIVRLGNIAFASNPFERFIDYMHRIQRQSPYEQTFIVQLSHMGGMHGGYLPTERAVANKGYSAEPFSYSTDPKGGATLVAETVRELKRLQTIKK